MFWFENKNTFLYSKLLRNSSVSDRALETCERVVAEDSFGFHRRMRNKIIGQKDNDSNFINSVGEGLFVITKWTLLYLKFYWKKGKWIFAYQYLNFVLVVMNFI